MMNQDELNFYFKNIWPGGVQNFRKTGLSIADNINPEESVLDVGCGRNLFKDKIKNLIGIDPAFEEADYQTTIEDFRTNEKFDVALCLGSINFGSLSTITHQIECIIDLLKPSSRIYWRCNPGLQDHGNSECTDINFFPWSIEWHRMLADYYGFKITEIGIEKDKNRIYATWVR
jgi:hypothetical protein